MPTPQKLKRIDENGQQILEIHWDDGVVTSRAVSFIQDRCPCATCGEKRKEDKKPALFPVLSLAEVAPVKIDGMHPAGNYAYTITFSSGCNQGIFTFTHLRNICES
jgi:DUF971 family protein